MCMHIYSLYYYIMYMCKHPFLKKLGILTFISINSIPMFQENTKSFPLKRVKIKNYGFRREYNLNCFQI